MVLYCWPAFLELDNALLILDPSSDDGVIVASSVGFRRQTGYAACDLEGASFEIVFEHVPPLRLSASALADVKSFIRECMVPDLLDIGDVSIVQPMNRKDGSIFLGHLTLVRCAQPISLKPYVLGVQVLMTEDINTRLVGKTIAEIKENSRRLVDICRGVLLSKLIRARLLMPVRTDCVGDFAIYRARLQDHTMILDSGAAVARREPSVLNRGCLVFGDRPLKHRAAGLQFSVRVDCFAYGFCSWPYLGFTARCPEISKDLYPMFAKCCGASLLIGGDGHAFARDQFEHLELGFKKPSPQQLREICLQPELPAHKRHVPVDIHAGDILQVRYTWEGFLQLWVNESIVMSFNMSRPPMDSAEYFAVIDVGSSVSRVSLVTGSPESDSSSWPAVHVEPASQSDPESRGDESAGSAELKPAQ
eukprot:TRINITY_DN15881_c0_g1_i1.p1 TRINITY_DN15881_c0_g1~~TRINITY_DN15881_c0_g1_i1.p1  ORF type:complete len:419 (+),score=47.71 TRINITY_DN15881_c0_g1_i1:111-1367(+)